MNLITPNARYVYFVKTERKSADGSTTRETHYREIVGWNEDDRRPWCIQPNGDLTPVDEWVATFPRRSRTDHGAEPRRYNTQSHPWQYCATETIPAPMPEPVGVAAELDGSAFYRD